MTVRACAACETSIEHMSARAAYCGPTCRARARRRRVGQPERTKGTCRLSSCNSGVASEGLCNRHNHRRRRYGLSDEEMVALDLGIPCHICFDPAAHVDHSHDLGPGRKRGFLCRSCNLALGYFRDRTDLLGRAIEYLEASR